MGYLQVELHQKARYITAMITPIGLYQWRRLPFGLCSAPSAFQDFIARILSGCDGAKNMLDDIIVCGATQAEHDRRLHKLLAKRNEVNCTINIGKCRFSVQTVEFVGHEISSQGVKPLKSNVDAKLNATQPANIKQVQSFLGAANYYLKSVQRFAEISEPLRRLLRKDEQWVWENEQTEAFERLKQAMTTAPVLAHFDVKCKTIVTTDASDVAIGAVLSQMQNSVGRPVAFASRTLFCRESLFSK